jgi:hypothetical protein
MLWKDLNCFTVKLYCSLVISFLPCCIPLWMEDFSLLLLLLPFYITHIALSLLVGHLKVLRRSWRNTHWVWMLTWFEINGTVYGLCSNSMMTNWRHSLLLLILLHCSWINTWVQRVTIVLSQHWLVSSTDLFLSHLPWWTQQRLMLCMDWLLWTVLESVNHAFVVCVLVMKIVAYCIQDILHCVWGVKCLLRKLLRL